MKVLAIGGSPRGLKSQTNRLTEALLAAAKEKGAETDFIDLGQAKLKFCGACEACHRGPKCVLDDDGNGIMDRMLEADGIVLATPVYLDQVTAQMKTLLDRTSHFVHCLRLTGKYLAVVTTSGGGGGEATAAFLKRSSRAASMPGFRWGRPTLPQRGNLEPPWSRRSRRRRHGRTRAKPLTNSYSASARSSHSRRTTGPSSTSTGRTRAGSEAAPDRLDFMNNLRGKLEYRPTNEGQLRKDKTLRTSPRRDERT